MHACARLYIDRSLAFLTYDDFVRSNEIIRSQNKMADL